ncbi:MAG: hypothetical protein ACKVWR_10475 [Acidimicrobiales bacterium]
MNGPRIADAERGSSVLGAGLGFVVLLSFLLLATQLLLGLYARSLVSSAAFDAARTASGAGDAEPASLLAARRLAEQRLDEQLPGAAAIEWGPLDADVVELTVRSPAPAVLPGYSPTVERRVRMRVERVR